MLAHLDARSQCVLPGKTQCRCLIHRHHRKEHDSNDSHRNYRRIRRFGALRCEVRP